VRRSTSSPGPILRASLHRFDDDDHVLALTVHHIATDEWSTGLLLRELGAAYEAGHTGRAVAPVELPVQYGDYAAWQHARAESGGDDADLAYWRERRFDGGDGRDVGLDVHVVVRSACADGTVQETKLLCERYFGVSLPPGAPTGIRHGTGLYVLTLTGDRICAMTRFENSVLPSFGLPRSLPPLRGRQ
jgi:hypothetical protein